MTELWEAPLNLLSKKRRITQITTGSLSVTEEDSSPPGQRPSISTWTLTITKAFNWVSNLMPTLFTSLGWKTKAAVIGGLSIGWEILRLKLRMSGRKSGFLLKTSLLLGEDQRFMGRLLKRIELEVFKSCTPSTTSFLGLAESKWTPNTKKENSNYYSKTLELIIE